MLRKVIVYKSYSELYLLVKFTTFGLTQGCTVMAFPVVEFSREGYKIRKVFG